MAIQNYHNSAGPAPVPAHTAVAHSPAASDLSVKSIKCPSCGYAFIEKSHGKSRVRTRVLVFTGNGDAMGICPKCKASLKVPLALTLPASKRELLE